MKQERAFQQEEQNIQSLEGGTLLSSWRLQRKREGHETEMGTSRDSMVKVGYEGCLLETLGRAGTPSLGLFAQKPKMSSVPKTNPECSLSMPLVL